MNKTFAKTLSLVIIIIALIFGSFAVWWYQTHPSQTELRAAILNENGFHITQQRQNVTARFTLEPSWIPSGNDIKNSIHKVFYQDHNTQLYVDSVYRNPQGDVDVVLNSTSTFSKEGGTFVSSIVVVQNTGTPDAFSYIPWHTGWLTKDQIPRFENAITHQQFILNFGSGEGPDNQLMFSIPEQDVKKYFSAPVTVTIPDYNLITYVPYKS